MKQGLFVIQVTVRVRSTHPDAELHLTEGGGAHAIVVAASEEDAADKMRQHMAEQHFDVLDVMLCRPTDPNLAIGHADLERLVANAMQFGVGVEIFLSAFQSDRGPAN